MMTHPVIPSFKWFLCNVLAALTLGLMASPLSAEDVKFTDPPPLSPNLTNLLQSGPVVSLRGPSNLLNAALPDKSAVSKTNSMASMETLDDKHKLAIGDRLSFRILEDQEDPTEPLEPRPLMVADNGEVEVPYAGRMMAEGKTCRQFAQEIKAALEKDYYYQATVVLAVDVMTKSRGRVYVVGPVRMPGPQEIPSDETLTLSRAILRAGGFTDYADKKNVKVTRKGKTAAPDKSTFVVDVGQILDKGRTELDLPLESGDLILVQERLIRF